MLLGCRAWLGESFTVQPINWGKYRFLSEHKYGRLGITESRQLPQIRIQPRAEHLHAVGPLAVWNWWSDLLDSIVGSVFVGLSRVDLFADWQGWRLLESDASAFVCRARCRSSFAEHNIFSGFTFGKRASGTVSARIYDKTLQMQRKPMGYWFDVWGDRYVSGQQVLRVEFELGRRALREFGVESAQQGIAQAPAIWGNLSENWLTLRTPTDDETRSRWPVSQDWEVVQHPSFRSEAVGLERVRAAQNRAKVQQLLPGLTGYLSSFGAVTGCEDIEDSLALLPGPLRDYGIATRKSFPERIRVKRARWA